LGTFESIPSIISLLDDPDGKVVDETVLTLAKLSQMTDLPISNENMSDEERRVAVKFWKDCWSQENCEESQLNFSQRNTDDPRLPDLRPRIGLVNDYAKALSTTSKERLELLLTELKQKSDIEFVILTIPTTSPVSISNYTFYTVSSWGLDTSNNSSGGALLLVVAVDDSEWYTAVGPNLLNDLPNDVVGELGEKSFGRISELGGPAEAIEEHVRLIIDRLEKH